MQFSTEAIISLKKQPDLSVKPVLTIKEKINEVYEISRCVQWIKSNSFQKVCLQFPDYLLPDSPQVALRLQEILNQTVYVLGDTAYGSCCIDYVAAAHINADAVIHFGSICFSKSSNSIPYLNVYEKKSLNIIQLKSSYFSDCLNDKISETTILLLDTPYIHYYDKIVEAFRGENVDVIRIDKDIKANENIIVFIGDSQIKLRNIQYIFKPKFLYYYNATSPNLMNFKEDKKILKKRYFLMEKIKDSSTIGIVIDTMSVKNFLNIIERLKRLIELSGRKYYLISVGKPTVAKLANFGEIDLYVIITCSMNEIFDNSKEYYKPIVTPYDIEIALNPKSENLQFSYDFNSYLNNAEELNPNEIQLKDNNDVSLLTGSLRCTTNGKNKLEINDANEISTRSDGTLALNSHYGAGYLNSRAWKGLEQKLGQTGVKLAEEGLAGFAQKYTDEGI